MGKWEYKKVTFNDRRHFIAIELNTLGEQGWELMHMNVRNDQYYECVFKRRRRIFDFMNKKK